VFVTRYFTSIALKYRFLYKALSLSTKPEVPWFVNGIGLTVHQDGACLALAPPMNELMVACNVDLL
jgi:hypothetical protein